MKTVLVICGGKSAEHEISLSSTRNIISAIDRLKFAPLPVVVTRAGCWYLLSEPDLFDEKGGDEPVLGELCTLMKLPSHTVLLTLSGKQIPIDLVFPLIHGPMGEDGTLQGFLEIMDVPYVGSGVLSSAIGMDKDILKQILEKNHIPVGAFITVSDKQHVPSFEEASKRLDSKILFIKPSVMGSSVGISKVKNVEQYKIAVEQAFQYSFKVLIEKYIPGREIECAVLGNSNPEASCVGEVVPHHEFYSYEAKYLDPEGAELIVPAALSPALTEEIRRLAIQTFQVVECRGLARVDFFISEKTIYVNEINTLPGFTAISMYPKMWQASGVDYTTLITRLMELAEEEYCAKQSIHLCPDSESSQEPLALKAGT